MFARQVVALALLSTLAILSTLTCAGPKGARRYPRRSPGCALKIFHTPMPEAVIWDDIGPLEVGCYLDESESTCLSRLRTEACRMGGDIIYTVPKRALPPDGARHGVSRRGRALAREPQGEGGRRQTCRRAAWRRRLGSPIVPLAPATTSSDPLVPLPAATEGVGAPRRRRRRRPNLNEGGCHVA